MGMAKHETGNGHSYLAKTKNNLFGFNAIDQDPINSANTFKDKGESIDHVAKFLKENYLSEDGKYYNGISTKSIGKLYHPEWSNKVDYMMREVCRRGFRKID
ncbi:MAG: glucosaminidase domain-containing protein [Anaerococcus obesiensis]